MERTLGEVGERMRAANYCGMAIVFRSAFDTMRYRAALCLSADADGGAAVGAGAGGLRALNELLLDRQLLVQPHQPYQSHCF